MLIFVIILKMIENMFRFVDEIWKIDLIDLIWFRNVESLMVFWDTYVRDAMEYLRYGTIFERTAANKKCHFNPSYSTGKKYQIVNWSPNENKGSL